ncbi:endolytic transglycosylase MltG [Wukongibacter baidiensis]|uniref:endolytic transglycosylase MltG n=1 Tax=Wukongibacter baidiensis TaxID=1723361 RepID=UPI003D7FD7E5
MRKLFLISIVSLFIISIVIGTSVKFNSKYSLTVNTNEVFINIDKGSNLNQISSKLKNQGVIKSLKYFTYYTRLKGLEKNLQAGIYTIPAKISLDELLEKLQNPQKEYIKVTIPEGYNLYQITKELAENNLIDEEVFLKNAQEGLEGFELYIDKNGISYKLEGYLFPDTYFIPKGLSEKEIIDMMIKRFNEKFLNVYKKRAEELGLSIHDVVTISSLIEKEAANDKERKTISGVIYNRMEKNMPLQIDASVIYGITKGKDHIARLMYSDLESESEYNTYKYTELPPSPIASPGQASIEAALFPEKHDYLYYVLGTEGHVFSKTYKEHRENVKKYIN